MNDQTVVPIPSKYMIFDFADYVHQEINRGENDGPVAVWPVRNRIISSVEWNWVIVWMTKWDVVGWQGLNIWNARVRVIGCLTPPLSLSFKLGPSNFALHFVAKQWKIPCWYQQTAHRKPQSHSHQIRLVQTWITIYNLWFPIYTLTHFLHLADIREQNVQSFHIDDILCHLVALHLLAVECRKSSPC